MCRASVGRRIVVVAFVCGRERIKSRCKLSLISVVSDPGRADYGIEGFELTSQTTGQASDYAHHPETGQAHAVFLLEPALPPLQ